MEKSHWERLSQKFPETLEGKRVVCLNIPDEYDFMDPALIDELQGALAPYVILTG
jgi:predicted protein tyrosine phosphatase